MGKTKEDKKVILDELKHLLEDCQLAMVIDYQGLSVAEITDLRRRLRPTGTLCKVTKNTLMRIVVEEDTNWKPMTEFLAGPSAFLLVKEDIGGAVKAFQAFQKESKKSDCRGGVMEGVALNANQIKAIADLPSKEQLMAQIAGALNAVTAKIAIGINEVPASLGRSIQAIADKEEA